MVGCDTTSVMMIGIFGPTSTSVAGLDLEGDCILIKITYGAYNLFFNYMHA